MKQNRLSRFTRCEAVVNAPQSSVRNSCTRSVVHIGIPVPKKSVSSVHIGQSIKRAVATICQSSSSLMAIRCNALFFSCHKKSVGTYEINPDRLFNKVSAFDVYCPRFSNNLGSCLFTSSMLREEV